MIKIIVDTNIIFSALLNTQGTIGDLIFNSERKLKFYSCDYMQFEIEKHWPKLIKISKLSNHDLTISQRKVFANINFINESLIPSEIWERSEKLVKDIDVDDIDFIALTEYLKGKLRTGDKQLYSGLAAKKYKRIVNTSDLLKLRN